MNPSNTTQPTQSLESVSKADSASREGGILVSESGKKASEGGKSFGESGLHAVPANEWCELMLRGVNGPASSIPRAARMAVPVLSAQRHRGSGVNRKPDPQRKRLVATRTPCPSMGAGRRRRSWAGLASRRCKKARPTSGFWSQAWTFGLRSLLGSWSTSAACAAPTGCGNRCRWCE